MPFNIAACVCAFIGGILNLCQPFFFGEISVISVISSIPNFFRYGLHDALSPYFSQIPQMTERNDLIFFVIIVIIFLLVLIVVPYKAMRAGVDAFRRNNHTNYVKTLLRCESFMWIIAIGTFMLPFHLRRSLAQTDPVINVSVTLFFDTMLPWTTPAIWGILYGLAAYFAKRDVKENNQDETNSEAHTPQPNNPPDNHNDETQPSDNKAQKFFDKAGKTLEQSLEVGVNLLKSSQSFVKQKIDEAKSHKESTDVNDKAITVAKKPEVENTDSEAHTPQPNNPPDNHNDETQPSDNKAQKFFDKAAKTLEQSLEVGVNLLKSSQSFVKQKIDEAKSRKESTDVNDKAITVAEKPEVENKYQESLKLYKTIADSYSQNIVRLNDYFKLVDILISIGDYKNSKDIANDILEKLNNIRSRIPEERLKARPELQQMIDNLENMLMPDEIEIPQHDHELKYHEALTVKESIEKYYSQNRVRPQDYSKLFEILSEIGDYKDAREITANTLTKLKNMRSKLSAELLKKKPELQKLQQTLDKLIEKFSNI